MEVVAHGGQVTRLGPVLVDVLTHVDLDPGLRLLEAVLRSRIRLDLDYFCPGIRDISNWSYPDPK